MMGLEIYGPYYIYVDTCKWFRWPESTLQRI